MSSPHTISAANSSRRPEWFLLCSSQPMKEGASPAAVRKERPGDWTSPRNFASGFHHRKLEHHLPALLLPFLPPKLNFTIAYCRGINPHYHGHLKPSFINYNTSYAHGLLSLRLSPRRCLSLPPSLTSRRLPLATAIPPSARLLEPKGPPTR